MQNIKVSRWLFPLPVVTFLLGFMLTWSGFEELAGGLMLAGLAQFTAQVFLLRCVSCGKSPYIRQGGGRPQFSAPMPERICSKCQTAFEAVDP